MRIYGSVLFAKLVLSMLAISLAGYTSDRREFPGSRGIRDNGLDLFDPAAQFGVEVDAPDSQFGVALRFDNPLAFKHKRLEAARQADNNLLDAQGNYNVERYCRQCHAGLRRFCSRCLRVQQHRYAADRYPGAAPPPKQPGISARVAAPDVLVTTRSPSPVQPAVSVALPAAASSQQPAVATAVGPAQLQTTAQQQFNQQAGFLALQSRQPAAGVRTQYVNNANYGPAAVAAPAAVPYAQYSSQSSVNTGVAAPGTPWQSNSAPAQSYAAPSQSYGAPSRPSQSYGAPSQSYGAPSRPSQSYGAPSRPSQSYGAPSRNSKKFGFQGKSNRPSQSYGPPRRQKSAFNKGQRSSSYYRRPKSSYGGGDSGGFNKDDLFDKDDNKIKDFFRKLFGGFGDKGDSYSSYDSHGSYSVLRPVYQSFKDHEGECPAPEHRHCSKALSRRPCLRYADWECERDEKCCYQACLGHPVCTKAKKSWWKIW